MKKFLYSAMLALALLASTAGTSLAQETTPTPISGTVQSIAIQIDTTTNTTTVLVSLLDAQGNPVVVVLDLQTATSLGLVTTDPITGETTVSVGVVGTDIQFTPPTTSTGDMTTTDGGQQPIAAALADYFGTSLGVDYETIMGLHDQGMGFGVIAQALWMTDQMNGDAELFQKILNAKLTGDYSGITLPDGSTPANWGQFRKSLLQSGPSNNLGYVMSGKEGIDLNNAKGKHDSTTTTTIETGASNNNHGNGNNGNHGNGNGNNNHGNNNGNGNGNNNGHGGGRP